MTRDDAQAMIDAVEARMLEKEIVHKANLDRLFAEHERKRRKINRVMIWFAIAYAFALVFLLLRSHA